MLFKSIRSSIAALTSFSIVLACVAVIAVSLSVYEELYLDSVKKDLDGLSSNLANDLLSIVSADIPDDFELTTSLLRLDRYENVKFAAILDKDYQTKELYGGKSLNSMDEITNRLNTLENSEIKLGVGVSEGELIAFKQIGEISLPQGYLLIVNDVMTPLAQSKETLLYRVLPLATLIILIGIFVSAWQNYRMLNPLKQLAELARKIKRTNDYSIKLEIEGKREVKDLSDEISSMMSTIDEESTKNKAYTEQLKNQRQAMEHMANYDSLTGLPNRPNFLSLLDKVLAASKTADINPALLYCDLDGFKAVNDLHGHEIGDKLLIEVSERLKSYLLENDVVSRLGGDEFLILLADSKNQNTLISLAEKIVAGLGEPFEINGWEVNISVSVGISYAKQSDYDATRLIANADIAMYRSKVTGKNTYAIFEANMMSANKRRIDIANAIPHAIKDNEFELHYQPKVDKHENVLGFEALIRWNSAELGFISPVEFICIAEQSGKINMITQWVINKVCENLKPLQDRYGKHIVVALNLSANDLKEPHLLSCIHKAFKQHSVRPQSIEFEVTESALLENFEQANFFFDQLALMGCSVALDDFGTGYSSLSYLTKIKLNTLKIDKQFIDGIGVSKSTTLITKTIVEMAKNLSLKVCAEGVETEEQKAFLLSINCEQLQGYLFSKPLPLEKLIAQVSA
ncbi:putative bifunctional diguanylate cyclase/phosphodiesterase [Glaciecola sp. SC05]|uniref:putative bifunctional diguanylate cyclase/phosphodiesterase n=1 Tax=Glaciecola sp. SC05 TaxID=1987355 RepID=UPI0035284D6D